MILAPEGTLAGVDVRGAAPGAMGTEGLGPTRTIHDTHAIFLAGGSAWGLAAAGGIMRWLDEHGIGLGLGPVRVPAVAGAVVFDLLSGDPKAFPDADAGYAACDAATRTPAIGAVGAGTGATVAKAGDRSEIRPGGLGIASSTAGEATVAAVMVANGVGGIWDDEGHEWIAPITKWDRASNLVQGRNTTIGVVLTDAALTKEQAIRVAIVAHDGIARAVRPAHTMYDGDAIFCFASGRVLAPPDAVEVVAADVVARALAVGVRATQQSI